MEIHPGAVLAEEPAVGPGGEPDIDAGPHLALDPGRTIQFPERGQTTFLNLADLETRDAPDDPAQPGVWLFHTATGLCGLILDGADASVNGRPVVGLSVLHDGDQVRVGEHQGVYTEVSIVRIGAAAASLPECLFCKTGYVPDDEVARCPLCHARYHSDCWGELRGKRCCSPHCAFVP